MKWNVDKWKNNRYVRGMDENNDKLSGRAFWSPLEGGYLSFRTVKGEIYKLEGIEQDKIPMNKYLEIEGTQADASNQMGIGFGVPIFLVKSIIKQGR